MAKQTSFEDAPAPVHNGLSQDVDAAMEAAAEEISATLDHTAAQSLITSNRGALERMINHQRTQKRNQQASIAAARRQCYQLTESIRSLEDALDRLSENE